MLSMVQGSPLTGVCVDLSAGFPGTPFLEPLEPSPSNCNGHEGEIADEDLPYMRFLASPDNNNPKPSSIIPPMPMSAILLEVFGSEEAA